MPAGQTLLSPPFLNHSFQLRNNPLLVFLQKWQLTLQVIKKNPTLPIIIFVLVCGFLSVLFIVSSLFGSIAFPPFASGKDIILALTVLVYFCFIYSQFFLPQLCLANSFWDYFRGFFFSFLLREQPILRKAIETVFWLLKNYFLKTENNVLLENSNKRVN